MDALRAWVEERLAPVVLVAGTPAAEAIVAAATGLSLVDLLRPQARVRGISGARSCAGGGRSCGGYSSCRAGVASPRGAPATATAGSPGSSPAPAALPPRTNHPPYRPHKQSPSASGSTATA